jgi:hypothetical protein
MAPTPVKEPSAQLSDDPGCSKWARLGRGRAAGSADGGDASSARRDRQGANQPPEYGAALTPGEATTVGASEPGAENVAVAPRFMVGAIGTE